MKFVHQNQDAMALLGQFANKLSELELVRLGLLHLAAKLKPYLKAKRADSCTGNMGSLSDIMPTRILDLLDNPRQHPFRDNRGTSNNKALLSCLIGQFP